MGGGGGKGGGTTVQSVQIPPEVLARYNAVNARAEKVAEQPFQRYEGEFVAPLSATQQAGIAATSAGSQIAQPYYGAATGLTLAGAQGVMPGRLNTMRYMSPFTQAVAAPTYQALAQEQAAQRSGLMSPQTMAAFGGDRSGLVAANLARQQQLGMAQGLAPIYQQGYQQAQNIAAQQQAQDLAARQANLARYTQAGAQLGGIGAAAQQAALSGAQAQIGAGTLEQQTRQAQNTALYNQFLQERGYPFQVAQFLANIAEGTGALSGSTTTTQQPGSFFSDERDKTNIKPLGKGLYAYDYKEDVEHARETGEPMPPKRVGPMAQDIEKQAPGLVVSINGHKVVTPHDDNSMGGAVLGSGAFARGGYANGGYPDFGALLQAQQAMFGGPGQQQKSPGLGIPSQKTGQRQLMTPAPLPQRQRPPNMFKEAGDTAKGVEQAWTGLEKLKKALTPSATGDNAAKLTEGSRVPQEGGTTTPAAQTPAATTPAPAANTGLAPTVGVTKTNYETPEVKEDLVQNANFETPDVSSGFDMIDLATGGRAFAYGGLVPRKQYAGAGFVTPGYDTEHDPSDIMDTVVEEGEQSPQQLLSQQKGMAGSGGGGGGGGGGMSPLSALSAGASIASLGAKVLPFFLERGGSVNPYAYGGLVPRERHADGESVGDQPREEPSKGLGVDTIMEKITPSGVNAPENFWVPALSFVGGMLTSPSRTLAGSVGSGLLSGVQGYTDLSKQQAAVAKNVIDVFKDRYTETIDPYTNKPVLHNSFTGQNHQPGEVHAALYKSLKAAGVSPEKYGVFAPGAAKEPPREGGAGTTTQETPRLPAPAAGEGTVVAQTAPAEAPKSGEAKPAEEAAPMSKEMMNRAQLREDVLRNPKMYGLGQEVIDLQARIKGYNDRAKAFSGLGAKGEAEVARNEALAEKEKNRLETLIQNAVDRQDSYNKESDKLQLTSSNKYAEEAEKRMNAYEARRKRLILLSEALADFKAGRASPALASFQSYAKSLGVPIVGNIGDSSYAASFDTALKAASSEIVNDIATSNTQRAPASMSQLLSKAVAGPTMDPGAAYEVLGATLGELDAQHAKDMEFKRGMDPLAFHQQYYKKDPKALDKYTAKAFSDLSIPKGIDPKIIERVNDMYGQHGYRPKGAEEVGAKPAAAPVRVKSIDEARQLPSGTVFIDPNGVTRRVP